MSTIYKNGTYYGKGEGGTEYTDGDGIVIENNEISTDNMESTDMPEIVTPLPSVMSRRFKYSTEEQIVGEWIDGKPLYQKTINGTWAIASDASTAVTTISNLDQIIDYKGVGFATNYPNELRLLDGWVGFCYANKSNGIISVKNSNGAMTWTNITIQYTKTTD